MSAILQNSLNRIKTFVTGRRRHVRHSQEMLQSSLGPVLNLSLGGARVMTKRPRGGTLTLELYRPEYTIKVECRVARCDRKGLFRYDIGLEFLNLNESLTRQITQLNNDFRLKPTIADV